MTCFCLGSNFFVKELIYFFSSLSLLLSSLASRAKLNMLNTVSKIRGQVKTNGYPQTEGLLGDCMLHYGHELGEDSVFGTNFYHPQSNNWVYISSNAPELVYPKWGVILAQKKPLNPVIWTQEIIKFYVWTHKLDQCFCFPETPTAWTTCFWCCSVGGALVDTGEGLRQMADVKDALDISVKQNFIDPLQNLQDKDLKEITVCFSRPCLGFWILKKVRIQFTALQNFVSRFS